MGLVGLFALITSIWVTMLTIRYARQYAIGTDEVSGVQKFHDHWVPRMGGLPMFVAFAAAVLLAAWATKQYVTETAFLLICLLPAFGIGLLEDLTRKVGVSVRLLVTMLAAGLGWWLLQARLTRLDLSLIDHALEMWPLIALCLTLIAAAGIAHAVNIIDGYNGLSGFHMLVVFAAMGWVAHTLDDTMLVRFSVMAAVSVLGFLIFNFPRGHIFMGDSGAYLLGFLFAELSILLVARHPEASPWFPMVLMVYPVWETIFSMARRLRRGFAAMGDADALHLHHLVYRRLMKGFERNAEGRLRRNAATATACWSFSLLSVMPALIWAQNSRALMLATAAVVLLYLWLYTRLVTFRAPRWMGSALRLRRVAHPSP